MTTEKSNDAEYVSNPPKRMLYGAIGAEDGQCAYVHPGIGERCTNDATAYSYTESGGERQRVEMCDAHRRDT